MINIFNYNLYYYILFTYSILCFICVANFGTATVWGRYKMAAIITYYKYSFISMWTRNVK